MACDWLLQSNSDPLSNCTQNPDPPFYPTFFDKDERVRVDKPALFGCVNQPNVACDLTFATSIDLQKAFGRVGYDLTLTATVAPTGTPGQFTLAKTTLCGDIHDVYQLDFAFGAGDRLGSDAQTGFKAPVDKGQIYRNRVQLDTLSCSDPSKPGLDSFTYLFH